MARERTAYETLAEAHSKVLAERDELRALWLEWLDGMYDGRDLLRRVKLAVHGPLRKPGTRGVAPSQPPNLTDAQIMALAERHLSYVFTTEREEVVTFARALLAAHGVALPETVHACGCARPMAPVGNTCVKCAGIVAAGVAPSPAPSNEWAEAERLRDLPEVDEALLNFKDDCTGDNAAMVVRAVRRAVLPDGVKTVDGGQA